jgi:mRNA interferase MazF
MKRFDIYLISLDPTRGSEISKTRPCAIVSPDGMNGALRTVIVAPLTSTSKGWPSRVACAFGGKLGEIALDQIRAVDKKRLVRRIGRLGKATMLQLSATLVEMFAFEGEA